MPKYAGQFEYASPGAGVEQGGPCAFSFDDRTATLEPADGPPLAFDLGDIDRFQPGEWDIRLSLYTGHVVTLLRFGKALRDLTRELLDAYRDRLVKCLLVGDLDEVARFSGRAVLEPGPGVPAWPAEIRLFESNLAVLPDAAPGFQWRLADISTIEFDEARYAVVLSRGSERLTIGHLAKRTGEFAESVRSRITALDERTARTLHGLFPFLEPGQFRRVASLLRDGACAPVAALRSVHASTEPVLMEKVVDPALRPYVDVLVRRAAGRSWYVGLKVIRRESGETGEMEVSGEERDPSVFEAGDGLEVLYWFFFPLSASGGATTHVAWEATSRAGRATYLFRLSGGEPIEPAVSSINRGLVALNFRREPIYLEARTLESDMRYRHYAIAQRKVPDVGRVRQAFAGRAVHATQEAWEKQIEEGLSR
jgi:hypothetical protein